MQNKPILEKILKSKKLMAGIICMTIAGTTMTTAFALESVRPGWHGNGADAYYITEEGSRATGWVFEDGATYFFNEDKELATGFTEIDSHTYYFAEDNGQMQTGEVEVDGQKIFLQLDGRKLTGWQEDNTMYYDENGYATTGWAEVDGTSYYFNAEGKAAKGLLDINGVSYFFEDNGTKAVGLKELNGTKYYFNNDGAMVKSEEVEIDGVYYYFDSDGTIRTTWYTRENGDRYYFDENANKVTGLQDIKGYIYYFDEDGIMAREGEHEGYEFASNGVGTKKVEEKNTKANTNTNNSGSSNDTGGSYPSSSKGAAIIAAARAQLGVYQDCTMLVTNSLRAVGIYYHGWPAGYMSLGTIVPYSQAQAGDLIYYSNGGMGVPHIAVYAGGGMAVHGGFNGNQTIMASAFIGSGQVFIRVH